MSMGLTVVTTALAVLVCLMMEGAPTHTQGKDQQDQHEVVGGSGDITDGVNLGAHFINITIPSNPLTLAWVDIKWRRKLNPPANSTGWVLVATESQTVVSNIVMTTADSSMYGGKTPDLSEAAGFVFEPVQAAPIAGYIDNPMGQSASIVVNCSGTDAAKNGCWKATDNILAYSNDGDGEGWNANTGVAWIILDITKIPNAPTLVAGLGVWTETKIDDSMWWPIHNPAKITVEKATANGAWTTVLNAADCTHPDNSGVVSLNFASPIATSSSPYWRISILCERTNDPSAKCDPSQSHSWIKEIKFRKQVVNPAPPQMESNYQLFYLPYTTTGGATGLNIETTYIPLNQSAASAPWRKRYGLTPAVLQSGSFRKSFPEALDWEIGATDEFESFDPMELPASRAEQAAYIANHPTNDILFFPEDRNYQVKMNNAPPARWIVSNLTSPQRINSLSGIAEPGEDFAIQLGIWAIKAPFVISVDNIKWTDLTPSTGSIAINRSQISCPNIAGIDFTGSSFTQSRAVPVMGVNSIWLVIPVPAQAQPGSIYTGELYVQNQKFNLSIQVNASSKGPIANGGANDLWRMSRLSWLDSTRGIDRQVSSPYVPITVTEIDEVHSIYCVQVGQNNRSVVMRSQLRASSPYLDILTSVNVSGRNILSSPLQLQALDSKGSTVSFGKVSASITSDDASATMIRTTSTSNGLTINSSVEVNYDGYIEIALDVKASSGLDNVQLQNLTLQWELPVSVAQYVMGLGYQGRNRTASYLQGFDWLWSSNANKGQNELWVGTPSRGMRIKWKGEEEDWNSPLHTMTSPPMWAGDNGTSGGISLLQDNGQTLIVLAYTGPISFDSISSKRLNMDVLITPVKEIDVATHFSRDRYYQYGYNGNAQPEDIANMGVKVLNVHQGTDINPYINYPFNPQASQNLKNFSDTAKSFGVKSTCIYYTTRELSNRCYEMPTLLNIGTTIDHVFDNGTGGGAPWLHEHLDGNYTRRWSTGLADNQIDAAIGDASLSRWVNYYVEGLAWLRTNGPAIDGLYLDELAFGRKTMQRMRKSVDVKAGALFDLHSCNKFKCGIAPYDPHSSSMLIYSAHFAYLNSIWFGEGFNPNESPDYWLIEMSGIAFGILAEQLTRPNLWRGMVFAEGARPAPDLWKAWDTLQLTTPGTKIIGWWDDEPLAKVSDPDVRASMYVVPAAGGSRYILAIASWANNPVNVSITPAPILKLKGTASAIAIANYQPAVSLVDLHSVAVQPGQGWLLSLDQ